MNVNKIVILIMFIPFLCFSQNKKEEVYFIINKNHKKYKLNNHIIKTNVKSFRLYDSFVLYDRVEFNKRQKEISQEKKKKITMIVIILGVVKEFLIL